jgi:hypothetical protein
MKKAVMGCLVAILAVSFLFLASSVAAYAVATPTLEWVQTYPVANTYARGITTDSSGNAYVAGSEVGDSTATVWIRKYDTLGNTIWTQWYVPDDWTSPCGHEIALDTNGNVYVVGHGDHGGWTSKFSPDGNLLWERIQGQSGMFSYGFAIAVDASGNAYSSVGPDTLVKYDTDGNLLWTLNDPFIGPSASGITVDAMSNVVVAKSNGKIGKFDPDGNLLWETQTGSTSGFIVGVSQSIATDAACNIYAFGYTGLRELLLVKYDPDGNTLWTRTPAGGGGITVDSDGYIYVAGSSAVAKYDSNGNEIWTEVFDNDFPGPYHFQAADASVDSQDNVYLSGRYGDNITVVKYNQIIPEPGTLFMLVSGILGIAGFAMKRRSR